MIKAISIKCPECGASLEIEEGRTNAFCTYCGAKIIINNENEHIIRHIDEAEIKQAETERLIRLKELEMEDKEQTRERKIRAVALITALVFVVVGVISMAVSEKSLTGMWGIIIGAYIGLFTFIRADQNNKKKTDKINLNAGKIKLPSSVADIENGDYRNLQTAYLSLGFINVSVINLRDLKAGILKKPGVVEEVTINGEEPEADKWYDPNSAIIITYHDFS